MGNSSFWAILNIFLQSNPPLLTMPSGNAITLPVNPEQELSVTTTGRDVLSGKKNWLDIMEPDTWIGGVHLTAKNAWCWDRDSMIFVKRH